MGPHGFGIRYHFNHGFWAYSQAPATAPTTQPAQKSVGETTDAGVAAPTAQAQADAGPASAPSAAKAEAPQEAAQTEKKDGDKKEKYDWKGSSAETTARNFLKLLSAKKYADAYASGSGLLKSRERRNNFKPILKPAAHTMPPTTI